VSLFGREIICLPSQRTYWDAQPKYSDTVVHDAVGTLGVSKATLCWNRTTPAGTREDLATINLCMSVVVGEAMRANLTDVQKTAAETPLKAYIDTICSTQDNSWAHQEIVWHDIQVGDTYWGPADRRTTYVKGAVTSAKRLPDQLAVTVTMKTSSRTHWGRVYLGGLHSLNYDTTYGRVVNAICDQHAAALRTLGLALAGLTAETELLVFSKTYGAVMSIDEIQCDNVVDIIRRRRAKSASYRKTFTA
jgi:hypothetical protein